MIKINTIDEFNSLKSENTVFLFSAKWCPDCRFIEPFMPEIEGLFKEFNFVYVDRDQFIDVCIDNNVYGIPSFIVYKNNEVVGTFISKLRKSKNEIIEFLNTVK